MKTLRWFRLLPMLLSISISAISQTGTKAAPISDSPEAMQKLLAETAATYRNAKSYRINRETVEVVRGEYSTVSNRTWEKKAAAPGYRYRVEIKDDWGWSIVQSDGTTEWSWYPWRKQYAEQSVDRSADPEGLEPGDGGFVLWLKQIDKKLANGRVLAPQTITVGGRRVNCMVILGPPSPRQQPDPSLQEDHTYFLDRDSNILVQEQWATRSTVPEHTYSNTRTITYTLNEFNAPMPESLFKFVAKPEIERVEKFDSGLIALVGKTVPPLKLKTLDNKDFDLESLHGKPILVDFWATWCVPCRESMPHLEKLYTEYKDKLAIVSVSKDDDPEDAVRFVTRHNYSWVHLSDPRWESDRKWGSSGIPRMLLIGKDGKVLFESDGFDEVEEVKIRAALHNMDPSFPAVVGAKDVTKE